MKNEESTIVSLNKRKRIKEGNYCLRHKAAHGEE